MEGINYKEVGVLLKLLPDPEKAKENLVIVQVLEEYIDNHACEFYSTRLSAIEDDTEVCFSYPMILEEMKNDDRKLVRPHKKYPYHLGKNILKEHLRYLEI